MPALISSNSQLPTPKSMRNNSRNFYKSHQTVNRIADKTNKEADNPISDNFIDNASRMTLTDSNGRLNQL